MKKKISKYMKFKCYFFFTKTKWSSFI